MTEIGFVDKVSNGITTVRVAKKSACGENCASCKGGCTPSERVLEVKNPIGAEQGERVVLELPEGRLLTAAFLAYILPLLFMIAGCILADFFYDSEWQMVLGGSVSFAIGFLLAKIISKRGREKYMAEIVRVLE